jgi:hypothetical protein
VGAKPYFSAGIALTAPIISSSIKSNCESNAFEGAAILPTSAVIPGCAGAASGHMINPQHIANTRTRITILLN